MNYFSKLWKILFAPTWEEQLDQCLNSSTPEEAIAKIDWSYLCDYDIKQFISTAYWAAGFEFEDSPIANAIADYCTENDPCPPPPWNESEKPTGIPSRPSLAP